MKLGDEQFAKAEEWEAAGRLALVGIGVEPGLSDVFARYAADHLFSEIDELGTRDGANLEVLDDDGKPIFAPSFSIWTTIEECLNPPVVYEKDEERGVVHDAAVQRGRGLRLPGGDRAGRVRQRGARGGAPHAALGRLPAGDVQVRPRRGVHRRAQDPAHARARPHRAGAGAVAIPSRRLVAVSPRDVVAACLPDPAGARRPRMRGKTCAGLHVTGTGKDGQPAVDVPLPRGRQRVVDARVRPPVRGLADRRQPGRRPRAARERHLAGQRRARARRRSTRCRSSTCSPSTARPGASGTTSPTGL